METERNETSLNSYERRMIELSTLHRCLYDRQTVKVQQLHTIKYEGSMSSITFSGDQ